jgi:hypothetical protein
MKKLILLFLFVPVFLFSEKILIQGHLVPGINPVVDGTTYDFYKIEKWGKLDNTIKNNLENSYKTAWETYFAKKGNLPSCVVNALDNLHTKVPEIKLTFLFLSASNYFTKHGLEGRLTGEKTIRNSNGNIVDYGGDIGGGGAATSSTSIFIIDSYQSFSDFNKFTIKSGECNLEYHCSEFDIENTEFSFLKEWQKQAETGKNTLAGIIFHEMVHIALEVMAQSNRHGDEATVEDMQLKIFPNAIPLYKNFYDEYLWKYINKGEKLVFEYFDGDWKRRVFNPPDIKGLIYQAIKDEINIIDKGISYSNKNKIVNVTHQEETDCQDARCEPMKDYIIPYFCKCDPNLKCAPQPPTGGSGGSGSGPAGDVPDDNYSFSSGLIQEFNLFPEAVVLTQGYWQQALKLYGGLKAAPEFTANALFESTPFLIVPTGGLFSFENDSTFKIILQEYVRLGGVILVLAQQFGEHIDKVVPIPDGASLRSYGWREDQSCSINSTYIEGMHPVLASLNTNIVTAAVDGYFSIYPSASTVLLRKKTNQEPCLLYYPYGNGTVILTSMYTDWGASHSQASPAELKLVRDLITFARNPNLNIAMYKLTQEAPVNISLALKIKNDAEAQAAKVKVRTLSPDRKIVFYENEQNITLAPGAEGDMPISFSVAYSSPALYGICHTDYELYDANGKLLQMATEADSGRLFA